MHEKSKIPFSYMLCLFCKSAGELNLKRALDEDTGACIFNDTTNIYIFPYSLQYTVSEFKNAIIKVIQCVFYN